MAPNEAPRRKPLRVALAAKAPAIAPVRAPAAIWKHNTWDQYKQTSQPEIT